MAGSPVGYLRLEIIPAVRYNLLLNRHPRFCFSPRPVCGFFEALVCTFSLLPIFRIFASTLHLGLPSSCSGGTLATDRRQSTIGTLALPSLPGDNLARLADLHGAILP